ncbi:MAG: glycosyltransferase family 1 protein [Candidatus Buchananbacteria bacterium]
MRIGIDARMFGPKAATGIGSYIMNLTQNLFIIDEKNEYFLFMNEPAYSEFLTPNNRVHKIKVNLPWYSLVEQIKFPFILLKYHLDLVHFPHFNAAFLYPKKFIVTIHDITPFFFPGPLVKKSWVRRLGYKLVFNLSIRRAKKIIVISHHTEENIIKYFKAKKKKINLTYLGLDSTVKKIESQRDLDDFKLKHGLTKPYLFYVGVWRDHKNVTGLIKAFNILKADQGIDCQLVLGGNYDPRFPEVKSAIDQSKFKSDIILPGFISQAELSFYYSAAKIFVLPSFCEGFGLVALESLACGVPVAGSNTTSLPEIIDGAGIYFDPRDPKDIAEKINQLFSNHNLYSSLKNQGFSVLLNYTWHSCAEKTLDVYQSS